MTLAFPALLVNATGEFLRVPSRSIILWFYGMYNVFIVVSLFFLVFFHTVNLIFLLAAHKS